MLEKQVKYYLLYSPNLTLWKYDVYSIHCFTKRDTSDHSLDPSQSLMEFPFYLSIRIAKIRKIYTAPRGAREESKTKFLSHFCRKIQNNDIDLVADTFFGAY